MRTHQAARYSFLWAQVIGSEEDRIIRENRKLVPESVTFYKWDIDAGVQIFDNSSDVWMWQDVAECADPGEAFTTIEGMNDESIVFMLDYHKYFQDITVVRKALNIKNHLRETGKMIVFLSATTDIPVEIASEITLIDFPLPNKKQLAKLLTTVAEDNEVPVPEDAEPVIDAMRGLSLESAENALCKCLVEKKNGTFDHKAILNEKAAQMKATGIMRYEVFPVLLDQVIGLEAMIEFVLKTAHSLMARGILIYGVPGCGKSWFAKAMATALMRACLVAEFNALRGKYQGEAEARIKMLFNIANAFGNPVVFCDELDKAVAGSESADLDSGVGQRIVQAMLVEFQDAVEKRLETGEPGPYWIATANSLDDILTISGGALASRFDAIFFVDMPTQEECISIGEMWAEKLAKQGQHKVTVPTDFSFEGYTGRDVTRLINNMAMFETDDPQAGARYVIPYKKANAKQLELIRKKAKDVCIWASKAQETVSLKRVVKMA